MWRADRPQRGRYRQFYQCDIDMIGEPTVLAEAELIEATTEALAAIGLSGTTVRLSDRRFLAALASECGVPEAAQDGFFIIVDKLDKIGWDGVRAELLESGFDAAQVAAAVDKIQGLTDVPADKLADALADSVPGLPAAVAEDLAAVADSLARLAAERALNWQFDPTLVRGMGYYTGQVFEVTHPEMSGSVAGGGRYDKLIGRSLGQDVPACGFSIGFERIVDLLSAETGPGRGRAAGRGRRAGGRRGGGGAGTAGRLRGAGGSGDAGDVGPGAWWRRCGGAGSSGPS